METLACALLLMAPPPVPEAPVTAEKVAARVQSFYERTDDLEAEFIQRYTRTALSRTTESRGTLKLKKPGMMRWDYTQPEPKHFIADGEKLYIYEPEEGQVIVDRNFKLSAISTPVSFLWGQGALTDLFVVALPKQKAPAGAIYLELTPKKDATYRKLSLLVDLVSGRVLESTLHETAGNTNHFKFTKLVANAGLTAASFKFVPPPDADIVEPLSTH